VSGFNALDYLDFDDGECAATKRSVEVRGPAVFKVEDKIEALFLSAQWRLVATVDGVEVDVSGLSDHARSVSYVHMWARGVLRYKKRELIAMGVDVEAEYVKHLGNVSEIRNC